MNEKECPKCGADERKTQPPSARIFECGSKIFADELFYQSDQCRIHELGAENAALRAEVERLRKELEKIEYNDFLSQQEP